MKHSLVGILIAICAGASAANGQTVTQRFTVNPCDQFTIKVLPPPEGVDLKLRLRTPPKDADYKASIFNPCKEVTEVAVFPLDMYSRLRPGGFFKLPTKDFGFQPNNKKNLFPTTSKNRLTITP